MLTGRFLNATRLRLLSIYVYASYFSNYLGWVGLETCQGSWIIWSLFWGGVLLSWIFSKLVHGFGVGNIVMTACWLGYELKNMLFGYTVVPYIIHIIDIIYIYTHTSGWVHKLHDRIYDRILSCMTTWSKSKFFQPWGGNHLAIGSDDANLAAEHCYLTAEHRSFGTVKFEVNRLHYTCFQAVFPICNKLWVPFKVGGLGARSTHYLHIWGRLIYKMDAFPSHFFSKNQMTTVIIT